MSHSLQGHILTPGGFIQGRIAFADDGRIAAVEGERVDERAVRDAALPIVVPGFIDLHVHGGAGRDIMEGGDAAARVSELHATHGTTAMLATTMTAPMSDLERAFRALKSVCGTRSPITPGPSISPSCAACMPWRRSDSSRWRPRCRATWT